MWKMLEMQEDEMRARLNKIKKRFLIIHKGGNDCDGYTSNSEEANFIVTLFTFYTCRIPFYMKCQKLMIKSNLFAKW